MRKTTTALCFAGAACDLLQRGRLPSAPETSEFSGQPVEGKTAGGSGRGTSNKTMSNLNLAHMVLRGEVQQTSRLPQVTHGEFQQIKRPPVQRPSAPPPLPPSTQTDSGGPTCQQVIPESRTETSSTTPSSGPSTHVEKITVNTAPSQKHTDEIDLAQTAPARKRTDEEEVLVNSLGDAQRSNEKYPPRLPHSREVTRSDGGSQSVNYSASGSHYDHPKIPPRKPKRTHEYKVQAASSNQLDKPPSHQRQKTPPKKVQTTPWKQSHGPPSNQGHQTYPKQDSGTLRSQNAKPRKPKRNFLKKLKRWWRNFSNDGTRKSSKDEDDPVYEVIREFPAHKVLHSTTSQNKVDNNLLYGVGPPGEQQTKFLQQGVGDSHGCGASQYAGNNDYRDAVYDTRNPVYGVGPSVNQQTKYVENNDDSADTPNPVYGASVGHLDVDRSSSERDSVERWSVLYPNRRGQRDVEYSGQRDVEYEEVGPWEESENTSDGGHLASHLSSTTHDNSTGLGTQRRPSVKPTPKARNFPNNNSSPRGTKPETKPRQKNNQSKYYSPPTVMDHSHSPPTVMDHSQYQIKRPAPSPPPHRNKASSQSDDTINSEGTGRRVGVLRGGRE